MSAQFSSTYNKPFPTWAYLFLLRSCSCGGGIFSIIIRVTELQLGLAWPGFLLTHSYINTINCEWTIAFRTIDSDVPALTAMQAAANPEITICVFFRPGCSGVFLLLTKGRSATQRKDVSNDSVPFYISFLGYSFSNSFAPFSQPVRKKIKTNHYWCTRNAAVYYAKS